MNVFDTVSSDTPATADYRLPEPPLIASKGITWAKVDFETNGLRWFGKHRPGGVALLYPSDDPRGFSTTYLSYRHHVGPNFDPEVIRRYLQTELKGVHITNLNTRFDCHMAREDGVDWEAMGCKLSDVGHYAAHLDDHRQSFSLESLCLDYLPENERKVKTVDGVQLNAKRMMEHHPAVVGVRAEADVRQVHLLEQIMLPKLKEQDLMRVKELEDRLIYVVCEMEKNGAHIDIEKLDRWEVDSKRQLDTLQLELSRLIGRRTQASLFEGGKEVDYFNPDSSNEMEALFQQLGLPISKTESGRPSFTSTILKSIDHPAINLVLRISKLLDLRSKYLLPYSKTVDRSTGILRYALHQLRTQKDPFDDYASAGTVSGRFSSTKIVDDDEGSVGLNIQQIMKPEKQIKMYGNEYIVRELHIPEPGRYHLSADAMQIEYRCFASYTNSPRLIKVYEDNPLASFHKMVHKMLSVYVDLTYRRQKDLNFAKVYGAGLRKMALMMELITAEQYKRLMDIDDHKVWMEDPLMAKIIEINKVYNQQIPEAKPLLDRAKKLAEERGHVCTITGRRSRFPGGKRSHKALNAVIQGSAADIMKMKLVELHDARYETDFLMRYTVHDEVDGDVPNAESAKKVAFILNQQSYPFKVPIHWETNFGPNWREMPNIVCPLCLHVSPPLADDEVCSNCHNKKVV